MGSNAIAGGIKNGLWSAMGNIEDREVLAAGGGFAVAAYLNAFIKANDLPNQLGRFTGEIAPKLEDFVQEQRKALADFRGVGSIRKLTGDIFTGGLHRILKTMDEEYAIATGIGIAAAQGISLSDNPKQLITNLVLTAGTAAGMMKLFSWNKEQVSDFESSNNKLAELHNAAAREENLAGSSLDQEIRDTRARTVQNISSANIFKEAAINGAPWGAPMFGGDPFSASLLAFVLAPFGNLSRESYIQDGDTARALVREMLQEVAGSDYRVPSYTEIIAAREQQKVRRDIQTKKDAFRLMGGGPLRIGQLYNRSSSRSIANDIILPSGSRGYNLILAPSGIDGGKSDLKAMLTLKRGDVLRSGIYLNNIPFTCLDPKLREELIYTPSSSETKKTVAEQLIPFVKDPDSNDFVDALMKIHSACSNNTNHPLVQQYGDERINKMSDILIAINHRDKGKIPPDDPRKNELVEDVWPNKLKRWADPKDKSQYKDPNDLSDETVASVLLTEAFYEATKELFNFKSVNDAIRYLATKPEDGISEGERKAWDIWKALAKERLVVILDEPSDGLSRVGADGAPLYSRVAHHIEKKVEKYRNTVFIVIDHHEDYIDYMQRIGIANVLAVKHTYEDNKKHTVWSQHPVNFLYFDETVEELYGENRDSD